MKTDHLRESRNIEDRRGQGSSSFGRGGGGMRSSAGSGLLMSLLFSRLGWKGKIILVVLLFLFGGGGIGNLLGGSTGYNSYQSTQVGQNYPTDVSDAEAEFISKVLGTTEDFWTKTFQQEGIGTYQSPTLVFYSGQTQTGCGLGQAAAGPFYCSADKKIYLDMSFYRELGSRYNAKGDFAMAYVIAHEVGHHVQNELGTLSRYAQLRQGMSEVQANALTVRLELQADYYAGAWAKFVDGQGLLDVGDIDEAMAAAHAVGDDTLQEQAYGRVVPDSFTHGTSEQRRRWFDRGYQYGDIKHGDTFNTNNL